MIIASILPHSHSVHQFHRFSLFRLGIPQYQKLSDTSRFLMKRFFLILVLLVTVHRLLFFFLRLTYR